MDYVHLAMVKMSGQQMSVDSKQQQVKLYISFLVTGQNVVLGDAGV